MADSLRVRVNLPELDLARARLDEVFLHRLERAITRAVDRVGDEIYSQAEASLLKGGREFIRGFSVKTFPDRPGSYSLRAATIVQHKFPFAFVFDQGLPDVTARGKPYLWFPLPGLPKNMGRGRTTAKKWVDRYGKLYFTNRNNKPLLWGKLGGVYRPLFYGLDEKTFRKRFNISGAIKKGRERLGPVFLEELNRDG